MSTTWHILLALQAKLILKQQLQNKITLAFLSASTTSSATSFLLVSIETSSFKTSKACLRHSSAVRVRIAVPICSQSRSLCGCIASTAIWNVPWNFGQNSPLKCLSVDAHILRMLWIKLKMARHKPLIRSSIFPTCFPINKWNVYKRRPSRPNMWHYRVGIITWTKIHLGSKVQLH